MILILFGDAVVFGIGEGSIEIYLDKGEATPEDALKGKEAYLEKTTYLPGETIRGRLVLKLNKPKKAKELRIRLQRDIKTTGRNHKGHPTHSTKTVLYSQIILGGEQEYSSGEYTFEIKIPPEIFPPSIGVILLGAVLKKAETDTMKLDLEAALSLPMSLDITRKTIVIVRRPPQAQV